MNDASRIPIPTHSRIAAGALGLFILGVGLWWAFVMIERGWWLMVVLALIVGLGGSPAFLYAAYKGSSPRWPDDREPAA